MVERLRKCLTCNEKYFCQLVLVGENKTLKIRVNTLAKQLRLSPVTIHNALRILEVAGCLKTEKSHMQTTVTIIKRDLIKKTIESENENV